MESRMGCRESKCCSGTIEGNTWDWCGIDFFNDYLRWHRKSSDTSILKSFFSLQTIARFQTLGSESHLLPSSVEDSNRTSIQKLPGWVSLNAKHSKRFFSFKQPGIQNLRPSFAPSMFTNWFPSFHKMEQNPPCNLHQLGRGHTWKNPRVIKEIAFLSPIH